MFGNTLRLFGNEGPGPTLGTLVLLCIFAFLAIYPLSMLVFGSLHSTPPGMAGEFNLDGYAKLFSSHTILILLNTLGISLTKTIASLVVAVMLAWIIARTDTPARGALEILITLPFFIPPILTAMAWGMLGNPQVGLINQIYQSLTGSTQPLINVYSYAGVVWHMMQYSTAFLFMFIIDIFKAIDPTLEDAARMCGASRIRVFFRITLVLMLPALSNAFILSFLRGIENFESPLFFGTPAHVTVMTTEIFDALNQRSIADYQYATAISIFVMVMMFGLVLLQFWLLRNRAFTTVTGKAYATATVHLGPWRWVTFAICAFYIFISFILPAAQLALGSFFKFFGFYTYDMLTLDNYSNVFGNAEFWLSLRNTLILGFIGATACMLLGSSVAYVAIRTKWKARRLIEGLAWLPWMMPGMVLGVGYLWAFALLPKSIPIYGTIWALFLAYLALCTPVSVRIMVSAFTQLSADLEECARVHGANSAQTMQKIVLALVWPSFAVGWILAFFGIMRELSASVLLYSADSEVTSVFLLKLWTNGQAEQVSVIGLMMLLMVLGFRWFQLALLKRVRA